MNKRIFSIIFLFLLYGCASAPEDLGTAYVSPAQFKDYDCDQVAEALTYKNQRLNTLYTSLNKDAKADNWQMGVGLVLFWPALFALEGGDGADADEYRRVKGEVEALQTVSVKKKCGF